MKYNYLPVCLSVALLGASAGSYAQTQAQAQTQTQAAGTQPAADDSAYTLKVPTAPASQVTDKGYELKSTSISGSSGASPIILTAPVESRAAYKTESGVYFYPNLFLGFGHNDNLLTSATDPIGSSMTYIAPELIAELKHKGDRYTALVAVNNVNYASSSPDNTTNSELRLAGDVFYTARARAAWAVGQVRSTDPRGLNNRPISAEPDRWTASNAEGRFIYGAPEAKGRMEFDVGLTNKSYDNNRALTEVSDVNSTRYAARMFYRLGTRSLALGEFRNAHNNYPSALSSDTNTERRYYVGLTWDATAATTGIVKVGRMTKDFDNSVRGNYDGESWEASIRWMPLTYTMVDLQTSRSTADSTGYGNFNLVTSTDLVWQHKWTRSLSSRLAFGNAKTDFGGTTRSDTTNSYSMSVEYAVMRWLRLGVDWAGTDNSSNDPAAAYKRNVTMFTVNASL